jgi:copper chaperone CopZ
MFSKLNFDWNFFSTGTSYRKFPIAGLRLRGEIWDHRESQTRIDMISKGIDMMRRIFVALALALAVFTTAFNTYAAESEQGPKLALATLKFADACCESSCAEVDKKLTSIEGISTPKTCSVSKTTTIQYNPQLLEGSKLYAALKQAGLKVESQMTTIDVKGMACTSCSSKVNKALTSLKGVKTNEVCHVGGQAKITFDPAQTTEKKLVETIKSLGYKASVHIAKAEPKSE